MDNTARRGMNDGTTTSVWYAYQDPRSGREYYVGPNGETSWALPTTRGAMTPPVADVKGEYGTVRDDGDDDGASGGRRGGMRGKRIERRSVRASWTTFGLFIIAILIFNTMFLLVLVRVIVHVDDDGRIEATYRPGDDGGATDIESSLDGRIVPPSSVVNSMNDARTGGGGSSDPPSMGHRRCRR